MKLARYRMFNIQVASLLTYKHIIIFLGLQNSLELHHLEI